MQSDPGLTPSERIVGEHIYEAFIKAQGKIFISTFASNVNRVQQVVEAAIKNESKACTAWPKYGQCGRCCH